MQPLGHIYIYALLCPSYVCRDSTRKHALSGNNEYWLQFTTNSTVGVTIHGIIAVDNLKIGNYDETGYAVWYFKEFGTT